MKSTTRTTRKVLLELRYFLLILITRNASFTDMCIIIMCDIIIVISSITITWRPNGVSIKISEGPPSYFKNCSRCYRVRRDRDGDAPPPVWQLIMILCVYYTLLWPLRMIMYGLFRHNRGLRCCAILVRCKIIRHYQYVTRWSTVVLADDNGTW